MLDKNALKLFQHWNILPAGAEKLAPENDPRLGAMKADLVALSEVIGTAYDKERNRRETYLDLSRLRWPVKIAVKLESGFYRSVSALTDHLGRLFIHTNAAKKEWFIPGAILRREVIDLTYEGVGEAVLHKYSEEQIHQVSTLSIGEAPVCFQVSTIPLGD